MIPLTPKDIIFDAVKKKLEGTGINKIILQFYLDSEKYNVYFSQDTHNDALMDIKDKEITMLKKMFIDKIVKKIRVKHDHDIKAIMLQMNFIGESFDVFYEDVQDKTYKFNF